jgi:hypothetical protein
MPDPNSSKRVIALALMFGAALLAVLAVLMYTGVVPLAEGTRVFAALAVGIAAFVDFAIGLWFFRMAQSS